MTLSTLVEIPTPAMESEIQSVEPLTKAPATGESEQIDLPVVGETPHTITPSPQATPEVTFSEPRDDSAAEHAAEAAHEGSASESGTSANASSETGNEDSAAAAAVGGAPKTSNVRTKRSRNGRDGSVGANGKSRKKAELESLLEKILSTLHEVEPVTVETKTQLAVLVVQCQTLAKELQISSDAQKRKRRMTATRKSNKSVKKESEVNAAEVAASAARAAAVESTTTPQDVETANVSDVKTQVRGVPKAGPVRGRVAVNAFRAHIMRQPPFHRPGFYDEMMPAHLDFNGHLFGPGRGGPLYAMRSRGNSNGGYMDMPGDSYNMRQFPVCPVRRPRERRDQILQEKEQANVRTELRRAETAADYQRAIEKAKRLRMDYEVASGTSRLEKILRETKQSSS